MNHVDVIERVDATAWSLNQRQIRLEEEEDAHCSEEPRPQEPSRPQPHTAQEASHRVRAPLPSSYFAWPLSPPPHPCPNPHRCPQPPPRPLSQPPHSATKTRRPEHILCVMRSLACEIGSGEGGADRACVAFVFTRTDEFPPYLLRIRQSQYIAAREPGGLQELAEQTRSRRRIAQKG